MFAGITARQPPPSRVHGRLSVSWSRRSTSSGATPMEKPKKRHLPRSTEAPRPGEIARAGGRTLTSYRVAALPIINHVLERMRLDRFLRSYLPRADRRCRIAPSIGISLLLKNVLLAREPLYGIGEWAAKFDPESTRVHRRPTAVLQRRPRRPMSRLLVSNRHHFNGPGTGDPCGPRVPG